MSDSLSVALAVDQSIVASGTPVTVTATITDTSTVPRAWTLVDAELRGLPQGSAAQPGRFLPARRQTVPAGGSLTLSAQVVFKASPGANVLYGVDASVTTIEDLVALAGAQPQVWVVPSSPNQAVLPRAGQLDLRSNRNLALL